MDVDGGGGVLNVGGTTVLEVVVVVVLSARDAVTMMLTTMAGLDITNRRGGFFLVSGGTLHAQSQLNNSMALVTLPNAGSW